MKKIILILILSTKLFSAEFGPTINSAKGGTTGGLRLVANTLAPKYIWRKHGESINEKLLVKQQYAGFLENFKNDNPVIATYSIRVNTTAPHSGIRYTYKNIDSTGTKDKFSELGLIESSENLIRLNKVVIKPDLVAPVKWIIRLVGDIYLSIDWDVPDGKYSVKNTTTVQFGIRLASYATTVSFDLLTYLGIEIQDINFGKVIFSRNQPIIERSSSVKFTGGHSKNIEATVNDNKEILNLKRVGGVEEIPIYVNLRYEREKGTTVKLKLDKKGEGNVFLDARLNPGLYPDVPDGKYSGDVRVTVKYN